jgi:hypothetical protein
MKNLFRKRTVAGIFAIAALIAGILFLDSGLTGNIIVNKQSPISAVSLIGLLLVLCSAVLIIYSVREK